MEVKTMTDRNPIEYTGKVLDKRNDLTGPDDSGKRPYPKRPQHVSIQQPNSKNVQ
jgi:hypothetical protein